MIDLSGLEDQLLGLMLVDGYPILAATLLLGAIGLPLPSGLVATVAGTLIAHGELPGPGTVAVSIAACVAGDVVGYGIGWWGGRGFAGRHGRWIGLGAQRLAQAEALFERWAGPSLLLSRSLLAIVGPAVNLLAGASRHRLRSFLAYTLAGRVLWVGAYLALGYVFSGGAEAAADFLGSVSGVAGLLGVAAVLAYAAARPRRTT